MAEEIVNKPVVETPEERRKRLAAERQARIQGYAPSVDKGKLASSQQYVDQMQKLAADPTYMPTDATPEERKSLQNILDEAQKQFEEAQNRAEWQDVAQTLSKALVQYGAARRGGENMDLSNISQPTVDYGARINAAQNTLAQRQKTALSKFELDRQAKSEEAKQLADEYRSIADALEAGRKTAQAREENESAYNRALGLERERAARDAAQAKQMKPDYTPAKLELEELDRQEKSLSSQVKAANQFINDKQVAEDLSRKSADAIEKNYGKLAAEAGINLAELTTALEATDKPGRLFGKNPDPVARQEVLRRELQPKLDMLQQVKQRKSEIIKQLQGASTSEQAPSPTAPAQKPEVTAGPTEEQVKKYAAQYKIPEDQARGILTKRMSGGSK